MTSFIPLTKNIAIAGALTTSDITRAHQAGFAAIICNRFDDEDPGQASAAELAEAAAAHGMGFTHIPITHLYGNLPYLGVSLETIDAMAATLAQTEGSALCFCRAGVRSTALWALAEARRARTEPQDILNATRKAGFELSALTQDLAALSKL